jgi:hypothetical protein
MRFDACDKQNDATGTPPEELNSANPDNAQN